nr:hypothetical protein K-LCC10_0156 [Kaumoebavirus]
MSTDIATTINNIVAELNTKAKKAEDENALLKTQIDDMKRTHASLLQNSKNMVEMKSKVDVELIEAYANLKKMAQDLVSVTDERERLKSSVRTLIEFGEKMEKSLAELEKKVENAGKKMKYEFECRIANRLGLPVEIRYKGEPVTVTKIRTVVQSTRITFQMNCDARYDEFTYLIDGKEVTRDKIITFSSNVTAIKPIFYRIELMTRAFPGMLKATVGEETIVPIASTKAYESGGSITYKTVLRFKAAPGLKKEDLAFSFITYSNSIYRSCNESYVFGELVQI